MRYFVEFSYKGTNYHGWQIQPNALSVQQMLNNALSVLLNQTTDTVGAGRTDSGVHARQMFAHFDSPAIDDIPKLIYKLNSYLPKDIAIHNLISVHDSAHARFDATSRSYEYHIHTKKNPFAIDNSWLVSQPLDFDLMNAAAAMLLGHRDFQCFSKSNTDVHTFNCEITEAYFSAGPSGLTFKISADRFLRNMVRAIVGTLVDVGTTKRSVTDFEQIIEGKNRQNAGKSAPAHGLFLTEVKYDYIKS